MDWIKQVGVWWLLADAASVVATAGLVTVDIVLGRLGSVTVKRGGEATNPDEPTAPLRIPWVTEPDSS